MKYVLVLFALGLIGAARAETVIPLEAARESLQIPNYSADERERLARQALLMLRELYVHRELKVAHFGRQVDPIPRLEALLAEAKKLTNDTFHSRISQIFLDLHDLHTNYIAPAPRKCGTIFIPVRFESVQSGGERPVLASRKTKYKAELAQGIGIGDRLLEVDGVGVEKAIEALSLFSGGANPDAIRTRSVQLLSLRSGSMQPLPEKDVVVLKLEGAAGKYTKEIPWQAMIDSQCLQGGRNDRRMPYSDRLDVAIDEYQRDFNTIFGPEKARSAWNALPAMADALSEVFDVQQISTPAGSLGYIRLKEFYWSSPGLDEGTIVEAFRRSVEEGLKDSVGLVIDVRGNPGGLITLAENLIQLFSRAEVEPTSVRMLANPLNREIFLRANGSDNRWSQSVTDAMTAGKNYAGPLGITPPTEANEIGQVWFRPTVVLTDANCYSACDLFVAGMKDSGAGKIIGLHQSTGGGGANVMEYETFRKIMAESVENPFLPLPHSQNMRVSWRQVIRAGKGAGKLIEDSGVESDAVVSLVPADIGGESKVMMKKIHEIVDDLQPAYTAAIGYRRGGMILLKNGETARWTEQVQGIDELELWSDGHKLVTLPVSPSDELKPFTVKAPSLKADWFDEPTLLVGKRNGAAVMRVMRNLSWRGEYLSLPASGVTMDFTDGNLGWIRPVLLHATSKTAGWQVVDGKLRIGAGKKYDSLVHARAFLPMALEGNGGTLTFDISLDAEDPHDSLRIYLINPDSGERVPLFAGSHVPATKGASVKLPLGWERVDAVFEFQSDENWNMAGPILDNVEIAPPAE